MSWMLITLGLGGRPFTMLNVSRVEIVMEDRRVVAAVMRVNLRVACGISSPLSARNGSPNHECYSAQSASRGRNAPSQDWLESYSWLECGNRTCELT